MSRRILKSLAVLLSLSFSYSQNLYAFIPTNAFLPTAGFNSTVVQLPKPISSDKSTLIGTPISAGINAGYQTGWDSGQAIINGINAGISQGVVSLGIDYATESAGLDPLIAGLTSRAITGAISGLFQIPQPDPNDPTKTITPTNIFDGLYQAFISSALNVGRLGISGTDAWSQAQYLQRVINFSTIVQQKGLAQAIDDSAAQILHEDAISSILRMTNPITNQLFKSVGEFIQYAINNNKFIPGSANGNFFRELTWGDKGQYKIDATNTYSDVTKVQIGDEIVQGTFGNVDSEWGLITGTIQDMTGQYNTDLQFQNIVNGQQTYVTVKDSGGNTLLVISPNGSGNYNVYDSYGQYVDSKIVGGGYNFSLSDGALNQFILPNNFTLTDAQKTTLALLHLTEEDLRSVRVSVSYSEDSGVVERFDIPFSGEGDYEILGENLGSDPNVLLTGSYWTNTSFRDKVEITENFYKGLGTRTNHQVVDDFVKEQGVADTYAKDGDIVVFNGNSAIDTVIKAGEFYKGGDDEIVNHLGVVKTIGGKKFVVEVLPTSASDVFGNAVKLTPLDSAIGRYYGYDMDSAGNISNVKGDFKVIRVGDDQAAANTASWLYDTFFSNQANAIENASPDQIFTSTKPVGVNILGLLNMNNNDPKQTLCSELFVKAYYEANSHAMLPGINRDFNLPNWQSIGQRISPQDIYRARDRYGKLLSDIVGTN